MMSRADELFGRDDACQAIMHLHFDHKAGQSVLAEQPPWQCRPASAIDSLGGLPQPAILKPRPMWTGKQLLSLILPTTLSLEKRVRKGKKVEWAQVAETNTLPDHQAAADNVVIRNGELLVGRLCKATVGAASGGIVDAIAHDNGAWAGAKFLSDAHRLLCYFFTQLHGGASIGLCDTILDPELEEESRAIVKDTFQRAQTVSNLDSRALTEQVREGAIVQILSTTRARIEALVMTKLGESNDLWSTVYSGAKGKPANIAQIASVVMQQMFNGERLQAQFYYTPEHQGRVEGAAEHGVWRTISATRPNDMGLMARGFVDTSFSCGLSVVCMFFHLGGSRVGLIDTAVKTAKVGYMLRKFRSAMMSNHVSMDGTTRNAEDKVVDFSYGDDGLDGRKLTLVRIPAILETSEDLRRRLELKPDHVSCATDPIARMEAGENRERFVASVERAVKAGLLARLHLLAPRVHEADPQSGSVSD